jgi:hypothetical protein
MKEIDERNAKKGDWTTRARAVDWSDTARAREVRRRAGPGLLSRNDIL